MPKEAGDFPTLYDRIAFLQASETGELFPCPGRSILVGRTRSCQINLDHLKNSDATSRKHATITRRSDSYWIRDERSSNGTIVEGVMLPVGGEIRLRNNSQIQFGTDGPLLIFFTPKTRPTE